MQKNNTKTALVSKKTERFRQKKLKSLKKQSVAVAVPVKNTVAASEKARLCVSFGIEAHKLEAVVRTAGGERKIVRFVHRMRGGDIKLVLDILNADVVRLVGLQDFADLTPAELSTGMKQRLGLARVLASQAQLLLMDEPFASLDFLTRGELQSQLLAIQKKLPRTIVLVTHQLEEALLLGQKIVVMHPDSTIREFDLSALPYPRDVEQPALRALKAEITDECRKPTASE